MTNGSLIIIGGLLFLFLAGSAIGGMATYLIFTQSPEHLIPNEIIKSNQIWYNGGNITIVTGKRVIGTTIYTNTHSMEPSITSSNKGILIAVNSPEELSIGDIIAFKTEEGDVSHRLIEEGYDEQGWWGITKGDNIGVRDINKVRFEDIRGVTIALIY